MNSYFSSVFTHEEYDNFPTLHCDMDTKLDTIHCLKSEMLKLLKGLNENKSPGPDNIPTLDLKNCAVERAPSLTCILNMSFSSGTVPEEWK